MRHLLSFHSSLCSAAHNLLCVELPTVTLFSPHSTLCGAPIISLIFTSVISPHSICVKILISTHSILCFSLFFTVWRTQYLYSLICGLPNIQTLYFVWSTHYLNSSLCGEPDISTLHFFLLRTHYPSTFYFVWNTKYLSKYQWMFIFHSMRVEYNHSNQNSNEWFFANFVHCGLHSVEPILMQLCLY